MAVSSGYGGPNFSQIERDLRAIAINFASIYSAQAQIFAAVNTWKTLQQQLQLTNAVAGGTIEQFGQLEQSARTFALTSTFSAQQVGQGFYELASAGLTVKEVMQAGTGVMLLAQATLSSVGEAADVVASAMAQFGLSAGEAYRISNVFVASINTSLSTLPKLAYALRQVGPVASEVGLSIEQTTGALDILFNAGLRGQQAGTALRNIITRLADPLGQGRTLLENLGVAILDDTGKMRDFLDILKELSTKNLSIADLTVLGGRQSSAALAQFLQGVRNGNLDKNIAEVTGTGAAFNLAAAQVDTLSGSMQLALNHLNDLRIEFTKGIEPALRDVLSYLSGFIDTLRGVSASTVETYAEIGLLVFGFGNLLKLLAMISPAMAEFKVATGLFADFTAAMQLAGAAGGTLAARVEVASAGVGALTSGISTFIGAAAGLAGVALLIGGIATAIYEVSKARQDALDKSLIDDIYAKAKATPGALPAGITAGDIVPGRNYAGALEAPANLLQNFGIGTNGEGAAQRFQSVTNFNALGAKALAEIQAATQITQKSIADAKATLAQEITKSVRTIGSEGEVTFDTTDAYKQAQSALDAAQKELDRLTDQKQKVLDKVQQITQHDQGIWPALAAELKNYILKIAGGSAETKAALDGFFNDPTNNLVIQFAERVESQTGSLEKGADALKAALLNKHVIAADVIANKLATPLLQPFKEMQKGIQLALEIAMKNYSENPNDTNRKAAVDALQKQVGEEAIDYILSTMQANGTGQELQDKINKQLNAGDHSVFDATARAVVNNSLSQFTAALNKAGIETNFKDNSGNVIGVNPAIVEFFKNQRAQYALRLSSIVNTGIKAGAKEAKLDKTAMLLLLGLPTDEQLQVQQEKLEIAAKYALSDYLGRPIDAANKALDEVNLQVQERLAAFHKEFTNSFRKLVGADALTPDQLSATKELGQAFSGKNFEELAKSGATTFGGQVYTDATNLTSAIESAFSVYATGMKFSSDKIAEGNILIENALASINDVFDERKAQLPVIALKQQAAILEQLSQAAQRYATVASGNFDVTKLKLNTGSFTVDQTYAELRAASAEKDRTALDAERLGLLAKNVALAQQEGWTEEQTLERAKQINDAYQKRIDLIGQSVTDQRQSLQLTIDSLTQQAGNTGNYNGMDNLYKGLHAGALKAAIDMKTIFEVASEASTSAIEGFADAAAGAMVGLDNNFAQSVANILRNIAKMIIQFELMQLIMAGLKYVGVALPGLGGPPGIGNPNFGYNPNAALGAVYQYPTMYAKGGMEMYGPNALLAGGVGKAKSPKLAIFSEGSYPEAFIPLLDGKTVHMAMGANGPFIPLPSGKTIPVSIDKYAAGGVANSSGADNVINSQRGGSGTTIVQHNIPITVEVSGNTQQGAAQGVGDEVGKAIKKQLEAYFDKREMELLRKAKRSNGYNA